MSQTLSLSVCQTVIVYVSESIMRPCRFFCVCAGHGEVSVSESAIRPCKHVVHGCREVFVNDQPSDPVRLLCRP